MKRGSKILLLGAINSSFVKDDLGILSEFGHVYPIDTDGFGKDIQKTLKVLIRSILLTFKVNLVVSWFADYYSALPAIFAKLIGKRFVTIAGGYDVINMPEIDWGAWVHFLRRSAVKITFKLSSQIWCQSQFTKRELLRRDPHLNPDVIYLGINTDLKRDNLKVVKQPRSVLTVGLVYSERRYWVKGVDRWLELARKNPDYTFYWVGFDDKMRNRVKDLPPNCVIKPIKDYESLSMEYASAEIYCQPSRVETFGRAVLESMLLGCFPIVSDKTALVEVIDKMGVIVDQERWGDLILDDLLKNRQLNGEKIEALIKKFDLANRKKAIYEKLKEL